MKQREKLTNEQAHDRIAIDCLCNEHARKPQPGDEYHKVDEVVKKTTGSQGNSI